MDYSNLSVWGASWSDDEPEVNKKGNEIFFPSFDLNEPGSIQEEYPVSIDIIPDDMQERILSHLPFSAVFKAACVCKKWNEIVHSKKFVLENETFLAEKPWYFMLTSSTEPTGHVYDPGLRRWYNFELPFVVRHTWTIAPSRGLVCFMDDDTNKEIYIYNPITREYETLKYPQSSGCPVYNALAFSVDQSKSKYTISIVTALPASHDFLICGVVIHVYDSKKKAWLPPVTGSMQGWRPGDVSAICDNVLYLLAFCTQPNDPQNFHGVISYNLDNTETSIGTLRDESVIRAPCALTCARLIAVKRKLVLVGGIGRRGRSGLIKGICIWVLDGREWTEVAKMPPKFIAGMVELDDVFASSGGGDLIYIQGYGGTTLVVYDMDRRNWSWSRNCMVHKRFPLAVFSGFCFEPRLQFF